MTVVAVASDFRKASSRAMGRFVGLIHRLNERGFRYTRNGNTCAYCIRQPARFSTSRGPEGLGPLLEFCVDLPTADADARAVRFRVHTARAGGGATVNTRVTLATVRGSRLGEDEMRGGSGVVVVQFWQGLAAWIDRAL